MDNKSESVKWVTAKEAAERIGVSVRTIQMWCGNRKDIFPSARKSGPSFNSPYRIAERDVIAYEETYLQGWELDK